MPDLLNPPALPQARRPFFTAENAREYALRSHALRKLRKENQAQQQIDQQAATETTPDLRLMRVLKQIDALDILLEGCKEPKEWDMLTRAKERLFKAWVHLAGIPGPGNRKPAPERRQPVAAQQLTPIPVAPEPSPAQPVEQPKESLTPKPDQSGRVAPGDPNSVGSVVD